jgi:hypothetical protein
VTLAAWRQTGPSGRDLEPGHDGWDRDGDSAVIGDDEGRQHHVIFESLRHVDEDGTECWLARTDGAAGARDEGLVQARYPASHQGVPRRARAAGTRHEAPHGTLTLLSSKRRQSRRGVQS